METRKCKECGVEKELTSEFFRQKIRSSGIYFYPKCKVCMDEQDKAYQKENKEKIKKRKAVYQKENKEKIKKRKAGYYQENKEEIDKRNKAYRQENKEEIKKRNNKWGKEKRKNDPSFRLRQNISRSIYKELKKSGSSKKGKSTMNYLPYTREQLCVHLESLFSHPENLTPDGQVWMTWENQGTYSLDKWDDADPTTWKWQVDHITPQSTFKFESMDSQEFRDCWALENLRPLSAKQNQLDGATKIRHKK
jgi:hypothetical protein